jgi:hypothetical protein
MSDLDCAVVGNPLDETPAWVGVTALDRSVVENLNSLLREGPSGIVHLGLS